MAGFQPPSPISNSQPLDPPTPHYFTLAPPPPSTPTRNIEEWFLLHIRVATAIVVLMILLVALIVKLCKCGRNSARSQLGTVELQSL
ncbi:hypothetical protein ACB092_04G165400 [Castanea dentata]